MSCFYFMFIFCTLQFNQNNILYRKNHKIISALCQNVQKLCKIFLHILISFLFNCRLKGKQNAYSNEPCEATSQYLHYHTRLICQNIMGEGCNPNMRGGMWSTGWVLNLMQPASVYFLCVTRDSNFLSVINCFLFVNK